LYGKRFIQIALGSDNNAEDEVSCDLKMGPCNELFFRIDGVSYVKGGDVLKVLFEGCRVPDELPLADMLKALARCEMVQD
jgi:hypothetical protein